MTTKLVNIFDDCVTQISGGESIEACLARYPDMREEVEPLLHTLLNVSAARKVVPSNKFINALGKRLMVQHLENQVALRNAKINSSTQLSKLTMACQSLWASITGAKRIAIPAAIGLLIVIVASFVLSNLLFSSAFQESRCTLSLLSGEAVIQQPNSVGRHDGIEGMTLVAGTQITTQADSNAMLTFPEGTTLELETDTNIEIQQLGVNEQKAASIVLRQWQGKTWSHVAQKAGQDSHYMIITPSALAIAKGTLFSTEVDSIGMTTVKTIEGLVNVRAKGGEVYLVAGQQTTVEPGAAPSEPTMISSSENEGPKYQGQDDSQSQGNGHRQGNSNSQGNSHGGDNNNGQGESNGHSNNQGQSKGNGQGDQQNKDKGNKKGPKD